MPLLIDGYNLLHATGLFGSGPGRTSLARSRAALLDFLVAALEPSEAAATTIVFDARQAPARLPRQLSHGELQVLFAEKHQEADELLETLIAAANSPRRLVVVSSDHRVQRAARRRRAVAIDSDRWYLETVRRKRERSGTSSKTTPDPADRPVSPAEVQAWMREFGLDQPGAVENLETTPKPSAAKSKSRPKPIKPKAKNIRPDDKSPSRRTPARTVPRRPRHLPTGDLRNPFPPGYGEDLTEDGESSR